MNIKYNPFIKTAIHRKDLSKPMRLLVDLNLITYNDKTLDYACGRGTDGYILGSRGYNIKSFDRFNPIYNNEELLEDGYDVVTNIYMFNTIRDLHEHDFQLARLKELGGTIYIGVRSDTKAVKPTWIYEEDNDTYLTSKGSYQRFYDKDKIYKYFDKVEFIHIDNDFILFKIINK